MKRRRSRKGIVIAGVIIAVICFFIFSGSSSPAERTFLKKFDLLKIDTLVAVNPAVAGERQVSLLGE